MKKQLSTVSVNFGLLIVRVLIATFDLRKPENNRFHIEGVTDEHGNKAELTDSMMDSFEIYLEALLPNIVRTKKIVVSKQGKGLGEFYIQFGDNPGELLAGFMKKHYPTINPCKVDYVYAELDAADAAGFAYDNKNGTTNTDEHILSDEWKKPYEKYTSSFSHVQDLDGEIAMCLISAGVFI